jgi:hypothetical protein
LVSLSTMIRLEVPHINVLSKIDLIESYGKLKFDISYYCEVQNLSYLFNKNEKDNKFVKMNKLLSEIVDDFSLVSFQTLNINDKNNLYNLLKIIDKSNGYIYGSLENNNSSILDVIESEFFNDYDNIRDNYLKNDNDEFENDYDIGNKYENDENENENDIDKIENEYENDEIENK